MGHKSKKKQFIGSLISKSNSDYFDGIRNEVLPYIPSQAKVFLDVGCAHGKFGAMLKKRDPQSEVWGAEISFKAAAIARQFLDKVIVGDIMQCVNLLPNNFFDCVVCNDSLEHMADPFLLLERIKTKLSRKGVIVSSVPNVRYYRNLQNLLFKKQWRYEHAGVLDRTHLRFFTEKSIRDMYEGLGYKIEVHEGINSTRKKNIHLLVLLSLGWLEDIRFQQFVTRVRPKK